MLIPDKLPDYTENITRYIEDVIYDYVQKKQITNAKYTYRPTPKYDKYIEEAAQLCKELEVLPSRLVQVAYDQLPYDKKEFFNPSMLRGANIKKQLKDYAGGGDKWHAEITAANIPMSSLWTYQEELLKRFMKQGKTMEEVLLDSNYKFYGWFRLLYPPNDIRSVIDKYKHIARKELNNALKGYIRDRQLNIGRIID